MRYAMLIVVCVIFGGCSTKECACSHGAFEHRALEPQHWVNDEYKEKTSPYSDRTAKLTETQDERGRILMSQWYSRDGGLLFEQFPYRDAEYYGVYLDDFGRIRSLMRYRNGVASGPALFFDTPARPSRVGYYREGFKYDEHVIVYPDEPAEESVQRE